MYTVIRKYNLIQGTKEELIRHVQESLVPLLNHVPGFRAYLLVDAGENDNRDEDGRDNPAPGPAAHEDEPS